VSSSPIRIATRASRLALWQANHVAKLLRKAAPDRAVEIVHISTAGDRDKTESLAGLGGQGIFTREVQHAVLDGRTDLAVHSLKDLPTEPAGGLVLAAVPKRTAMFDVLVLPQHADAQSGLDSLPEAARVGTGSPRRQAQLLHLRDDLQLLEVRGNVETRIKKLDAGQYDALVLAEAGLRRLGLQSRISAVLRPPTMYPAVGQGALGLECRTEDEELRSLLQRIGDPITQSAITAERSLLAALRAGCHAPVGVETTVAGDQLTLEAVVLSSDGRERLTATGTLAAFQAEMLGKQLAADLQRQGAAVLINPGT